MQEKQEKMKEKKSSPYAVFMWGALLTAVACFGLASQRLSAKRPARADAYVIAGILGLLSAAAAWSSGSAHERSRRSQDSLRDSLEKLQDRMQDLPRALMEDSVKVAEKERQERRVDQERQAGELRAALQEGLDKGFAPIAPALSERVGNSLNALSDALRADREERAKNLREMADTVSGLQAFQKEWAQTSSALLAKLGEQGTALQREVSERDASWRTNLEKLSAENTTRFQSAAESQLSKAQETLADLVKNWEEISQSNLTKMEASVAKLSEFFAANLKDTHSESKTQFEATTSALLQGLSGAKESLLQGLSHAKESFTTMSAEASGQIRSSASQAGEWLEGLSRAASTLQDAAQGAQRMGEESSANQAGMKAVVEMLNQSLTGVLDRLQTFAAVSQAQEALLEKMETTVRRFEERSAELLEENALKIQESFLDALERAEGGETRNG